MSEAGTIDAVRQKEFVGIVVEQISGTMTTLLAAIGDRLRLFKNLAEQGPATSTELASRSPLNPSLEIFRMLINSDVYERNGSV